MASNKDTEVTNVRKKPTINENSSINSKFVKQICTIVIVARILDWYQDLKDKNTLLHSAFSLVECLVGRPICFVAGYFGHRLAYIDDKAAKIIATMADLFQQPSLDKYFYKKPVSPAIRSWKKSLPGTGSGSVVVWCVDAVCSLADRILAKLQAYSLRKPSDKVLEEEGPKHFLMKGFYNHGLLYIVLFPLELYISVLKHLQCWLHRSTDHSVSHQLLSPEKMAEIQARRKVSPRKRSRNILARLFGLGKLGKLEKIGEEMKGELSKSPNKEESAEKKRKFEDVEGELESDESCSNSDLENYNSDEDPDYQPGNRDSTDSEEYAEGETESDIEFEYKDGVPVIKDEAKTGISPQVLMDTRSDLKQTPTKKNADVMSPVKSRISHKHLTPIKVDIQTKKELLPTEKTKSKGFVEGTPPVKTSTPRGKLTAVSVESKPEHDHVITEKKSVSPHAKCLPLKSSTPQGKSKEKKEKLVTTHGKPKDGKENMTAQMQTAVTSMEKVTQKAEKTMKQKVSKKTENMDQAKETKNKGSKADKVVGDKSGGDYQKGDKSSGDKSSGDYQSGDKSNEDKINGERQNVEKSTVDLSGGDCVSNGKDTKE